MRLLKASPVLGASRGMLWMVIPLGNPWLPLGHHTGLGASCAWAGGCSKSHVSTHVEHVMCTKTLGESPALVWCDCNGLMYV